MGVGLKDFAMVKYLGAGTFAKVFLVAKIGGKDDGRLYALKRVRKVFLEHSSKHVQHARNERLVLDYVRFFPYITTLYYAFETDVAVYIVTDYISGGDLSRALHDRKSFRENDVQIYIAETVLALEGLHNVGIIHRDVKERNILLDSSGHVVLSDFGCSKFLNSCEERKTYTFCGTVEYMAPEIINCSSGMDYAVDWWALGVLTCKLLGGPSPFFIEDGDNSKDSIFHRILHCNPVYPSSASPDAKDFIRLLLSKDPSDRLGSQGVPQIQTHPFFNGLDWVEVTAKTNGVPFVPPPISPEEQTLSRKRVPLKESDVTAPPMDKSLFQGFSYVAASLMLSDLTDDSSVRSFT